MLEMHASTLHKVCIPYRIRQLSNMGHGGQCVLVILVVIIGGCQVYSQEPCDTYSEISVDSRRLPSSSTVETALCDILISAGWYRLVGTSGTDLYNNTVPSSRCGTTNPLWMMGSIPTTSDGVVARTVCLSSVFSDCQSTLSIEVKNCCSYRVYYLVPPGLCAAAYCISSYMGNDICVDNTTTTLSQTTTQSGTSSLFTTEAETTTSSLFTTEAETTTSSLFTTEAETTTSSLFTTEAETTTSSLFTTEAETTTSTTTKSSTSSTQTTLMSTSYLSSTTQPQGKIYL